MIFSAGGLIEFFNICGTITLGINPPALQWIRIKIFLSNQNNKCMFLNSRNCLLISSILFNLTS